MHGFRNSGTVTLHIHAVLAAPFFEANVEGGGAKVAGAKSWSSVTSSYDDAIDVRPFRSVRARRRVRDCPSRCRVKRRHFLPK